MLSPCWDESFDAMKLHALDIASIVGFPTAFQLSGEPKYVIAAEHVWDYFECNLTAPTANSSGASTKMASRTRNYKKSVNGKVHITSQELAWKRCGSWASKTLMGDGSVRRQVK